MRYEREYPAGNGPYAVVGAGGDRPFGWGDDGRVGCIVDA